MIELYTAATPNGWKVSIFLEETGIPYLVHPIRLGELEQKEPWYESINPNGRIPAIVDTDADDFAVFESGAILQYLAEKSGCFLPEETRSRSIVMQWLMFQLANIGPMQGQANVFYRYAPEKIEFAIQRYQNELMRLYGILDRQLKDNEYIAGEYSIADMATWPWVSISEWAGVSIESLPNLHRWLELVGKRPAVIRGCDIPEPRPSINDDKQVDEVVNMAKKIIQR